MKCAWQAYINLLPLWMRAEVDQLGRDHLQELRLRLDRHPELIGKNGISFLNRNTTREDMEYCINAASQYSPWSAQTIKDGYLTAPGGHRLGICGEVVMTDGKITNIRNISSVCIRVARDFPGICNNLSFNSGSVLIIGAPGTGKTTFLRDLIRSRSEEGHGAVAVVDERKEIFPTEGNRLCFSPGIRTEILSGCKKSDGIPMLIRSMNPRIVAVDEITAQEDCKALIYGAWCGVKLMATAHAEDMYDFLHRPVYEPLITHGIFEHIVMMQADKSWKLERMNG